MGSVRVLAGYAKSDKAQAREILAVSRPDGTILVLDCFAGTLADARLLAHLAADEPLENALVVCDMYLGDHRGLRCRRLTPVDLDPTPLTDPAMSSEIMVARRASLLDARGRVYEIRELASRHWGAELRWTRSHTRHADCALERLTLRDVIAALERYEPARAITLHALALDAHGSDLSARRLREELRRLACSRIVLNRGLREAVERAIAEGLTMSEIAMRCGRTKRDRRGTLSGETSWLARRIGQMPEGGGVEPTAWVHTDTLALIARDGLGLSPNEVEL